MQLELITESAHEPAGKPPLLFVHGVCHGAWCWQEFYMPYFAERGRDCYALSLRGHGNSEGRSSLDEFGLEDYMDDVVRVIDEQGIRPILVGHSMGGGITQMVMHHHPGVIAGAILLASLPPRWLSVRELLRLLKAPRGLLAMKKLMGGESLTAAQTRRLPFFAKRISLAQAEKYTALLQPESVRARGEIVAIHVPAYKPAMPLLVLGSRQDLLFGETAVERTAAHYDSAPVLLKRGCHDLMLDPAWEESAAAIAAWLEL